MCTSLHLDSDILWNDSSHVYLGRICPNFAVRCFWFSGWESGINDALSWVGRSLDSSVHLELPSSVLHMGTYWTGWVMISHRSFSSLEVFANKRRWGLHTILCVAYNSQALGLSSYRFVYTVGLWRLHVVFRCSSWSSQFNLGFSAYFQCYASWGHLWVVSTCLAASCGRMWCFYFQIFPALHLA